MAVLVDRPEAVGWVKDRSAHVWPDVVAALTRLHAVDVSEQHDRERLDRLPLPGRVLDLHVAGPKIEIDRPPIAGCEEMGHAADPHTTRRFGLGNLRLLRLLDGLRNSTCAIDELNVLAGLCTEWRRLLWYRCGLLGFFSPASDADGSCKNRNDKELSHRPTFLSASPKTELLIS